MKKVFAFAREYWYLLVGFLVFPLVPVLFDLAKTFLPVAELMGIFAVIEVFWNVTFLAALIAFGLVGWVGKTARQSLRLFVQLLPTKSTQRLRITVVACYLGLLIWLAVVGNGRSWWWLFWMVLAAPLFSLLLLIWDSLKAPGVLKNQIATARDAARQNKWGQFWFYLNRLVAFIQPNAILVYLIWYRWQNPDWSLPAWVGNVVVLIYVILDNYSTWAFFRAFQLLIAPTKKEDKVVYKVFQACDYDDWGFRSLRELADWLVTVDVMVWPENQRAAPGSIYQRLVTSPATTFVLVRGSGKNWEVVGAMFTRALVASRYFPAGKTVFRVSWTDLENGGNFTEQPGADALYGVGIMVLPGEERGSGAMLEAALAEYAAAKGFRYVLGGPRLIGARKAYNKSKIAQYSGQAAFSREYVTLKDKQGWPLDETLGKLVRGSSIVVAGRKLAQLLQIRGVILDYFDDPESLDAAALVEFANPLWWLPAFLRPLWGKTLRLLLSL